MTAMQFSDLAMPFALRCRARAGFSRRSPASRVNMPSVEKRLTPMCFFRARASEVEFFGRHFVCTGFCMDGVFSASPKKTRAGPTS